jgi:Flp pilus assembly secretin CpaC
MNMPAPRRTVPLFALLLACSPAPLAHPQSLEVPPVATHRLAVGQQTLRALDNPETAKILSSAVAILEPEGPDRVILTAVAPGQTLLTYQKDNGATVSEQIIVAPPPRGTALEIANLCADIPGLSVFEANKRIVLDGRLASVSDVERVKRIADSFGEQILNLTRLDTGASNDVIADFIRRSAGVDGLDISILGDTAYLRGPVPNEAARSNVLALARTQVANVMDLLEVRETMIETEVLFIRAEKTKGHNWGWNLLDGSDILKMQAGLDGSKDFAQNAWSPVAVGVTWSASVAPVLNALVDAGKAEVVARPRIGTRLGQKGRFLSGGEMFYKVSGEVSGNLESVEYGIDLSVVPQFLANNTICNTLTMTLSFPVTQAGTSDLSLDKYTIESTIVCKVGQSVVISGIAEQIENQQNSRTPFLGSVPGLRLLFSNSTRTFKNAEIIVLITPRIMDAELAELRAESTNPRLTALGDTLQEADLKAGLENIDLQDQAARRQEKLADQKAHRERALAIQEAKHEQKLADRQAAKAMAAIEAEARQARIQAKKAAAAEKKAAEKQAASDKKAADKQAASEAKKAAAAEKKAAKKAAAEAQQAADDALAVKKKAIAAERKTAAEARQAADNALKAEKKAAAAEKKAAKKAAAEKNKAKPAETEKK